MEKSYDVVVIGSGAGGGAAAWACAEAGLAVLVLEAGPRFDPSRDYLLHTPDWELHAFPERPGSRGKHSYGPMQRLDPRRRHLRSWNHVHGFLNKEKVRQVYAYHHVQGVGGSTLHFTGEAHRLHQDSLRMATRFGVAADWPLVYQDLEPYYLKAETLIGVAGPDHSPGRPRSRPYPLPPHRLSYASQVAAKGFKRLGLTLLPNARAALSQGYDGRPPCNYCANCQRGCPLGDKGSVDVTFVPKAKATGHCEVRSGCRAVHIEAGKDDRIGSVVYTDPGGVQRSVRTRILVLACGAVETPRLLLACQGRHGPDGLANESGLVGRNFLETLSYTIGGLHPLPLGSWRGLPSDAICWDFNAPDAIPGVIGGCRFTADTPSTDLVGPVEYAERVVAGWGRAHKRAMKDQFGRMLFIHSIGEFLPNRGSYIALDPERKGAAGLPLARIHSHLEEGDLGRLDFMARKCREILQAAGVEKPLEATSSYDFFSASHVFGT